MLFRLFRFFCIAALLTMCCLPTALAQCQFTITHANTDSHCLYAEEEVVWKNTIGVSVSGNTITKNICLVKLGCRSFVGEHSKQQWLDDDHGYPDRYYTTGCLDFHLRPRQHQISVVRDSESTCASMRSLPLRIRKSQRQPGRTIHQQQLQGNVCKIKIDRGIVEKFYQNTTLLMESTVTPTLPLTVEATLNSWSPASVLSSVKVVNGSSGAFTTSAASPGAGATYQWFVDGVPVATGLTYTNTSLTSSF